MNINFLILFSLFLGIGTSQAQEKQWTLAECITYALENNITIKQSALSIESANIDTNDAIGNFLPSLNASTSNFWSSGLSADPISGTNRTQTFRSSSYGVSLGITLFDGLKNVKQFQRAKLNKLLSQYNLGKSKDDIVLLIANSYLQILLNKESLKLIEKQHEITLKELIRTQDFIEAGVLPQGDLLEIEAVSLDELTRIVQAENAVQIARMSLAQTLLIKDYENFDIVERAYLDPSSEILNKSIEEIRLIARTSRYEVQIAEQNKLIAEKELEIAKTGYYPSFSGSFSVSTRESDAGGLIFDSTGVPINVKAAPFFDQFSDNYGLSYGLSLSIPVFNGFSVRNAVKRSKINVTSAAFQLEQAVLDLDTNVYQAYLDAQGAAKAYDASKAGAKAQEKAYEYAKDRYNVGLTNAFDFSQSKFRLENSQNTAIQAKFDYIFKIKVLELYFGIKLTEMKL